MPFLPAITSRRACLIGAGAFGLALAGCAALPPLSLDEAVRRLLRRATDRAIVRLTEPGGAWDAFVASVDLPGALGPAGALLARALTAPAIHDKLRAVIRPAAQRAARRAAPVLAQAIRSVGIRNARAILAGGPHAASDFLRGEMGNALIEAILPEFAEVLKLAEDPVLGPLLAALTGGDFPGWVRGLVARVVEWIWTTIAAEEAAIRAHPASTGDPALQAALPAP